MKKSLAILSTLVFPAISYADICPQGTGISVVENAQGQYHVEGIPQGYSFGNFYREADFKKLTSHETILVATEVDTYATNLPGNGPYKNVVSDDNVKCIYWAPNAPDIGIFSITKNDSMNHSYTLSTSDWKFDNVNGGNGGVAHCVIQDYTPGIDCVITDSAK